VSVRTTHSPRARASTASPFKPFSTCAPVPDGAEQWILVLIWEPAANVEPAEALGVVGAQLGD